MPRKSRKNAISPSQSIDLDRALETVWEAVIEAQDRLVDVRAQLEALRRRAKRGNGHAQT